MDLIFFAITIYVIFIIFIKLFKMTFWDFIFSLNYKQKVILITIGLLLGISSVIFYKYVNGYEKMQWYFLLIMMLFTMVIYYVLNSVNMWLIVRHDPEFNLNKKSDFTALHINTLVEATIYLGISYLFITDPNTFWFWFYTIPLIRICINFLFGKYSKKLFELDNLSKREKAAFRLAEKQKDSSKLIDKKVKLQMELIDLRNELYHIQSRQLKNQ